MAYAYKNLKVTFGGRMYGGQEIWTNGITLGHEDKDFAGFPVKGDDAARNDIVDDIKRWFASPEASISMFATLEWVKFAVVDTNGRYASTDDGDYESNVTIDFEPVPGNHNERIAPQLSVALTMETNVRRGAGRYGRIYPPLTGSVTSSGYDERQSVRAEGFAKLIADINDSADSPLDQEEFAPRVIVASGVREGRNASVTNVKVGRIIDTQRSRRNALTEDYVTLSIGSV